MTRTLLGLGLVLRTDAPTPAQLYEQRLARYHASALRGIRRTWQDAELRGGGPDPRPIEVASAGPSCLIANRPRSMTPRPCPEFEPIVMISKNGKRLPLRAHKWRDLNREFWSRGRVVNADALERQQSRELLAHEKPIESMTLDELIATQDNEPLSESRRSWLTRGAGVMSLMPWDAYSEGSIGSTLVDPSAQAAIEAVCEDNPDLIDIEADAAHFGTPYTRLDPITAKQIEWEQRVYHAEPPVIVKVGHNAEGSLAIVTDRKLLPDAFMRLARSVKRTLADDNAGWDDIAGRFRAIYTEAAKLGFVSADATEEKRRQSEPADLLWHSSFEEPHPMIAILSEAPCLGEFFCSTDDCYCAREKCSVTECHRHIRVARTSHRTARRNKDELWRQRIFDNTAFELGTDGLVDPIVNPHIQF